eukprot:13678471-Alexandrium_andersonii.AAC.1
MSASLVGSEMCIRDSFREAHHLLGSPSIGAWRFAMACAESAPEAGGIRQAPPPKSGGVTGTPVALAMRSRERGGYLLDLWRKGQVHRLD